VQTRSLVNVGGTASPKPAPQVVTGRQFVEFPIPLNDEPETHDPHTQFDAAVGMAIGCVPAPQGVIGLHTV